MATTKQERINRDWGIKYERRSKLLFERPEPAGHPITVLDSNGVDRLLERLQKARRDRRALK